MIDHDSSASLRVSQESIPGLFRPRIAIVVKHDQLVWLKVQDETGHIFPFLRRNRQIDLEKTGILQDLFQYDMAHWPIVIVLPRDQQGLDGFPRLHGENQTE